MLRLEEKGVEFRYIHTPLALYNNEPDPTRISQGKDVTPTLHWYKIAGSRLTQKAKHIHYMRTQFMTHVKHEPFTAAKTLVQFALSYPLGVAHTAVHPFYMLSRAIGRMSSRIRKNEVGTPRRGN